MIKREFTLYERYERNLPFVLHLSLKGMQFLVNELPQDDGFTRDLRKLVEEFEAAQTDEEL